MANLERIRETIVIPGDALAKARLFDEGEGKSLGVKLVNVLVAYQKKMEATLVEIREVMGVLPKSHPEVPKKKKKVGKSRMEGSSDSSPNVSDAEEENREPETAADIPVPKYKEVPVESPQPKNPTPAKKKGPDPAKSGKSGDTGGGSSQTKKTADSLINLSESPQGVQTRASLSDVTPPPKSILKKPPGKEVTPGTKTKVTMDLTPKGKSGDPTPSSSSKQKSGAKRAREEEDEDEDEDEEDEEEEDETGSEEQSSPLSDADQALAAPRKRAKGKKPAPKSLQAYLSPRKQPVRKGAAKTKAAQRK